MSGAEEILDPVIAEARERKAAAEAKRAAQVAAGELAAKQRAALDEAALAEAIAEHGAVGDGVATASTGAGLVIVRRPVQSRWRRFERESQTKNEDRQQEIASAMISDNLVHPTKDAYLALVERYPALPPITQYAMQGLNLVKMENR